MRSIRFRLAAAYAAILAFILVILAVSLQFVLTRALMSDIDQSLTARGDRVATYFQAQGDAQFPNILQSVVDEYSSAPVFVQVLDQWGHPQIASRNLPSNQPAISAKTLTRVLKNEPVLETINLPGGGQIRLYSRVLTWGRDIVGVVQVGQTLDQAMGMVSSLGQILIFEGMLAVLLAGLAGYLLAWRGLAPMDHVVRAAQEIEAQHLDRPLRLTGQPSEVQRLADTFDAMLQRLHRAFEQQRQFTADVSHELRTPLTIIQGNLDVTLLDESQDPELRGVLMRMRNEVTRLSRLVSNLLLLARSDTGQLPDHRPVDLDILLLEVYRQAQSLSRGVRVKLGEEDQVAVTGDPDQLKQLLLNLVDNALKHTPAGGLVTLSLHRDSGFAKLTVADTGEGIPEEDLPHIFDRYYRVQQGKAAGKSGVGLGLAIAEQIAKAHGGRISARSLVGEGTTFEVCLPLQASDQHEAQPAPAGTES